MRTFVFGVVLAFIALLFNSTAHAQATATPNAQANEQASAAWQDTSQAPVPAPSPSRKAMSYYRSGNVLWVVSVLWGLIVPALFLFTGFSARIRDFARRVGRRWFFVIAVYYVVFALLNFVIDLPLAYYADFARQHAYDLSNQTFAKWFTDALKALTVSLVVGSLFLWVPYLLLRRSPRRWWLYTTLLLVPFLFLAILVVPVWIDPLFNDFGPMKDKALEAKILSLAERAGIEGGRVYEVNKSVDTKTVNAYVTGFLNTKRIVLWDTAIQKMSEDELLFVMGHEMGHYALGHVYKTILFISVLILITLYAAHRAANYLIARYKARFRFDKLSDVASLPLILLLVSVFSIIIAPVANGFSRYQEHEADRFGLEITRSNRAAATAFVKLQQENLSNPRPGTIVKLWRATHPPLGERIDFCNEYKPWATGEPLRYRHLFREAGKP